MQFILFRVYQRWDEQIGNVVGHLGCSRSDLGKNLVAT